MNSSRTTVTLNPELYAAAKKRLKQKMHSNFSNYVETLIRADVLANEDREDRILEQPAPYAPSLKSHPAKSHA